MTHEEILGGVRKFMPEFIGIYSTTFGWEKAKKTAGDIKKLLGREAFISAGGLYPIALQEHCLEDAGESVDAIVTGEGEFTSLEIIERLQTNRTLEGVLGVVYREGERIIKNPPQPLIEDLDSLPFPARGALRRYKPVYSSACHIQKKACCCSDNLKRVQQKVHLLFPDRQGA